VSTTWGAAAVGREQPAAAGWWGPVWSRAHPRSVVELLRDGTLDAATAAVLWTVIATRSSLIVAAGPSGAGKTTVLTALLDCLPPASERIYLRGRYESFAWEEGAEAAKSVLLVNEISPHLPIYLWDGGVRRLIDAADRGFQVLATAHATTVEELAFSLAGYPTRIRTPDLAALGVVAFLDARVEGDVVERRVRRVVALTRSADGRGLEATVLVERGAVDVPRVMAWLGLRGDLRSPAAIADDRERRRAWLEDYGAGEEDGSPAAVRRAIAGWR